MAIKAAALDTDEETDNAVIATMAEVASKAKHHPRDAGTTSPNAEEVTASIAMESGWQ